MEDRMPSDLDKHRIVIKAQNNLPTAKPSIIKNKLNPINNRRSKESCCRRSKRA